MPTLPTFEVTAEQATRALAAWGSVSAYKEWLRAQVVAYIKASERSAALAAVIAAQQAALATIDDSDPLDGAQ